MKRKTIIIIVFLVIAILFIGIIEASQNPLLNAVADALQNNKLTLWSPLSVWIDNLGEPQTIDQLDGGHTFFYWPSSGIAVFTHPHYKGQYKRKASNEWQITSIIIPLRKSVHPRIPPVSINTTIEFDSLLNLVFDGKELCQMQVSEIKNLYNFNNAKQPNIIEISNFPFPIIFAYAKLHLKEGRVELIELTHKDWLGWYD